MKCFKFFFCICLVVGALMNPLNIEAKQNQEIELKSEHVILINLKDDRTLYSKNSEDKMYPASLTKMMSALVAIENIESLDANYTFSADVFEGLMEANASVAGFNVNETITYRDLLYGILLPSGADASKAIAISLCGNEAKFVEKMNEKAEALNLKNTHFMNTSGLHDDNHYSSAKDMSIILKKALKNKIFKEIFCSEQYTTSNGRLTFTAHFNQHKQKISGDVSFIKGSKTGFTNEASLCLASYAQNENEEYIMISAQSNSDNEYPFHIEDAYKLYTFIFDTYKRIDVKKSGEVISELPIKWGVIKTYPLKTKKDISILINKDNSSTLKFKFIPDDKLIAPIQSGRYLGSYKIYDNKKLIYQEKYVIDEKIERNDFIYYIFNPLKFIDDFKYFILIVLGAGISFEIYNKKR